MRDPALVLIALAACGPSTDIDATLVFADRSDVEIGRLLNAASGADMFAAQSQVDRFADPEDPCPAISISGDTATITGGCTTADGVEIQGSASVTNPASWEQIEFVFGRDTTYQLAGFTLTQQGFVQRFDGAIRIEDFRSWDADLTTSSFDVELRSDIHYACSSSSCELEGSGIEMIGIGGAQVSGEVQISGTARSRFTLRGADTLTATIEQGCIAWQISGSDRAMVCAP